MDRAEEWLLTKEELYELGLNYEKINNPTLALLYYNKAAKEPSGSTDAQYRLAVLHDTETKDAMRGVDKDLPRAITFYEMAVKGGHVGAKLNLALHYLNGHKRVDSENPDGALEDLKIIGEEYLKELANDNDDPDASFNLGLLYECRGKSETLLKNKIELLEVSLSYYQKADEYDFIPKEEATAAAGKVREELEGLKEIIPVSSDKIHSHSHFFKRTNANPSNEPLLPKQQYNHCVLS